MADQAVGRKGQPFTVRLSPHVEDWIAYEAARTKRPKGAVLEALAEEAIRVRRFPGIAFRGPSHDRRAWLLGTALDVWEVIEAYRAMGPERFSTEGDLTEAQLRLALAYYHDLPTEIDVAIRENQLQESNWHARYPTVVPPAP